MIILKNIKELIPYASTPRQLEILNAIVEAGSNSKAAKALGVDRRGIDRCVDKVMKSAAKQGYSPSHDMVHPVPDGFFAKGVSTYYNDEGKPIGQWVKSQIDANRQREIIIETIKAMSEEIPRASVVKSPKKTIADLLNQYTITDYHMGMMAWHEESGEDWDIKIAEDLLVAWFETAIKLAPNAKVGMFAQLGDFLHWDGLDAVTPAHKNLLDADTRFQKVVRVAIRVIRRIIFMLLKKHDEVYVIMAEGNHDPASSIWLRELFCALYEDEPRVTVDTGADVYYCYEHGLTSLFYHHGHKRKTGSIDDVFVSKYREIFGRTKFSYAHMGHMHHVDVKETNLMIVEQHRTLASNDAHGSRSGYSAGRDAKVITYHKEYGEVGRVVISSDMVRAK